MSKLLIFNFDGTSNEPSDAEQELTKKGLEEDNSITNVLKFHLMCGGNLKERNHPEYSLCSWPNANQQVFYYHGIGTYGSKLKRLYNAGVANKNSDVANILKSALSDFKAHYTPGDMLIVGGFSRGSALARRFVAKVEEQHQKFALTDPNYQGLSPFVYEALYDTVASFGIPNMSKSDRPKSQVLFENGHSLPKNVIKALHCVSLDDKRDAFQPTLMNYQSEVVHEVWFSGAHSDVGGGYNRDGLSDVSLEYYLNWIEDNIPTLIFDTPHKDTLSTVLPDSVKYQIGLDDIKRNPNPFGKNHQQSRVFPLSLLTLTNRKCCVIQNDKISNNKPLVHAAVAARVYKDKDYRPESLKETEHTLIFADERTAQCKGLKEHIEHPRCAMRFLENSGDEEVVTVFASEYHNFTGLMLEKNIEYCFTVHANQKWQDASIKCGPTGWNLDSVTLGLAEPFIRLQQPFRRVDCDWFTLCGCVTKDDDLAFVIGNGPVNKIIEKSGEFLPFANDMKKRYGNNLGKIKLTVKRI
ncbi:MAG: DUF2235 domain-containing protein [Colwellia sp.]